MKTYNENEFEKLAKTEAKAVYCRKQRSSSTAFSMANWIAGATWARELLGRKEAQVTDSNFFDEYGVLPKSDECSQLQAQILSLREELSEGMKSAAFWSGHWRDEVLKLRAELERVSLIAESLRLKLAKYEGNET